MNYLQKQVLVSRFKSFLWRAAGYGLIATLAWMANNVGLLELPTLHIGAVDINLTQWLIATLGLVTGEVTKYFNSNVPWMKSQLQ